MIRFVIPCLYLIQAIRLGVSSSNSSSLSSSSSFFTMANVAINVRIMSFCVKLILEDCQYQR